MFAQNTAACVSLSNIYNVKDRNAPPNGTKNAITKRRLNRPERQPYLVIEESGAYTALNFRVKQFFLRKNFFFTVASETQKLRQRSGAYNHSIFDVKLFFLKRISFLRMRRKPEGFVSGAALIAVQFSASSKSFEIVFRKPLPVAGPVGLASPRLREWRF
jgi:hypothetical protein